jgi:hypothetical protein
LGFTAGFYSSKTTTDMSLLKFNPRATILLIMIVAISALRVFFNFNYDISPMANFSPLGAMALFGGAYFNKSWKALAFPLLTLFISDFILHQTVFKAYGNGFLYGGWYWVYGALALMTFVGKWIMRNVSVNSFLLSVVCCVFIHWIVTDLGVWIGSKIYAQTLGGFISCLIAAIPFEVRFITGTAVYGIVMFGLFEWMKRRYPSLQLNNA